MSFANGKLIHSHLIAIVKCVVLEMLLNVVRMRSVFCYSWHRSYFASIEMCVYAAYTLPLLFHMEHYTDFFPFLMELMFEFLLLIAYQRKNDDQKNKRNSPILYHSLDDSVSSNYARSAILYQKIIKTIQLNHHSQRNYPAPIYLYIRMHQRHDKQQRFITDYANSYTLGWCALFHPPHDIFSHFFVRVTGVLHSLSVLNHLS